jgi:hypothetical protein
VRLATCIALELAVGAGAVTGVWFGVGRATVLAEGYLATREASAAVPPAASTAPRRTVEPLPTARLPVVVPPLGPTVFPRPDDELLAPLAASPVVRVKVNHGGTSLSLRLDFASGARASFKPEQTHPQSDPRREIAAYRVDRLLGLGHVAPAKSARFDVAALVAAADEGTRAYAAGRIDDEAIAHAGALRGELQWWIPEIKPASIEGEVLDEHEGMVKWSSYLQAGARPPEALVGLLAQISACVVFDILIDNSDRWSGNNTMASPDLGTLYFMDNTLSFSYFTLGHETNLAALRRTQVFSRRLIGRLRALDRATVVAAVAPGLDPGGLGRLLDDAQIDALMARRNNVVGYVDGLIARFGEAAVLALP